MSLRIVRLGAPRGIGEGPRLGTVRRPPRGVPKTEIATRDFYDVWFPTLAPSQALLRQARAAETPRAWAAFVRSYRREMGSPDARTAIDVLSALSHHSDFSLGCYCENESRCHRTVLRQLLLEAGAQLAD